MDKKITEDQKNKLIETLKLRFEKNRNRHKLIEWKDVFEKLKQINDEKLWSLQEMESTGGDPDVIFHDEGTNEFHFYDCSPESPKGRRNLCYDRAALDERKEFKPQNSVIDMANEMGIELLDEVGYRFLQQFGSFDEKTSSWLKTPHEIRKYGGAIFGDKRYHAIFIYHNGAQSYYAARGFRGKLRV